MDKSDKYIKMCKEANEIHNHETESGDWYADDCHGLHILGIHDFLPSKEKTHAEICESEYVWLPRQDQLQEMIDIGIWLTTLSDFYEFISDISDDKYHNNFAYKRICNNYMSMEQLWLAFIMHTKYNKSWNGIN